VATAIGATAAHAKVLADHEEREMELLMATIIDTQVYIVIFLLEGVIFFPPIIQYLTQSAMYKQLLKQVDWIFTN
jgi:SWIRM-associated region 1